MLDPRDVSPARIDADRPLLQVVVDTEEEFDWSEPLARSNVSTSAIRAQERAHRIFERFGLKPTYVIDYPVADREDGYRPLADLYADGLCQIGAHLHPWVNPPHDEPVSNFNSYPGNLGRELEREKLRRLTERIAERFGFRPTIYKAGRYGAGRGTPAILAELGYEVDLSVLAGTDLSPDEGPDFSRCAASPYWFGAGARLLEIPMTVGFVGLLSSLGPRLYRRIAGAAGRALALPGVASKLAMLERITLSPEGRTHDEHRRLTEALIRRGHRVFSFTYHSPSLEPGHTPYVRTEADLRGFLDRFERYFDYFLGELGGRPSTAIEIRALAR